MKLALAIFYQNNHKVENFNINNNIDNTKPKDNNFV